MAIMDGCVAEGIKVVDVRHEQAATHAADAYARLTGRLGVALVTAGPGVTDAVTGVANAFYANSPMILIGGRHPTTEDLRGGLQEMDHPKLFHSITRWSETAWDAGRYPEYIATASRYAFSNRGGPVFMDTESFEQYGLNREILGDSIKYVRQNDQVEVTFSEE